MAKYKIAWMPGDGVGNDVMEAARIVLDQMKFDAEYVPCDIGWEFWCKEGNALPDRTGSDMGGPIPASRGVIQISAGDSFVSTRGAACHPEYEGAWSRGT